MRDSPDELVNHTRVAAVEPLRSCASINHDEYMEGGVKRALTRLSAREIAKASFVIPSAMRVRTASK